MYQERKWRIEDDFFLNLNRLNWLTLTLKISNVPNIKLLINFNSLQETRIGWNCSTDINLKYVTISKPLLIIRYKKLWQYPGMCCIWLHISGGLRNVFLDVSLNITNIIAGQTRAISNLRKFCLCIGRIVIMGLCSIPWWEDFYY